MQPDRFDAEPEPCPRCKLPTYRDAWTGEPMDSTSAGYRWHVCSGKPTAPAPAGATIRDKRSHLHKGKWDGLPERQQRGYRTDLGRDS